jgi:excisionase family DNA binding protein
MTGNRLRGTPPSGGHSVTPELLSTKEAARLLGVHYNTMSKWRIRGIGPRFVKIGTAIRYRRSDIETWLRNRTYSNTTEYGGQ